MCSKWCYVIVGVFLPSVIVAGGSATTTTTKSCLGGRSIRGLTELIDHSPARTTVSCCDENVCHGGFALKEDASLSFISPVGDPATLERYAQALESNEAHRHKRYSTTLAFFYDSV